MARNVDWSSLPRELLEKISKGLTFISDYIRFRAVCKSWLHSTPPAHLLCQIPWLMLPSSGDNNRYIDFFSHNKFIDIPYGGDFFSLSNNKIYHIDLPEAQGKRCFGSAHGWLCFVEKTTLDISLFNPFTKTEIQLPSIIMLPDLHPYEVSELTDEITILDYAWESPGNGYEIHSAEWMYENFFVKCTLSGSPTYENNYTVLIIYSDKHKLAFCNVGVDEPRWYPVTLGNNFMHDAIYHQRQFYGVDQMANLIVFDANPKDPKKKTIAAVIDNNNPPDNRYLVEVSGELLMVIRHSVEDYRGVKTSWFRVYRFIPESEEWIRVTRLDDHTLFLGMNSSISLSVKEASLKKQCKPNCIYFTDDSSIRSEGGDYNGGHDIGIFNLEDNSFKTLPCYGEDELLIWPPPMWITTSGC